jgi:hypothetical protein
MCRRTQVFRALDENINVHCPEYEKVKHFFLLRDGKTGKDRCSQVSIAIIRRRDGDGLYDSNKREQEVPVKQTVLLSRLLHSFL